MNSPSEEEAALSAPDPLKKNLDWYIENQKWLSEKYNGKVLLIVDQRLVRAFDSIGEAYTEALKSFTPGAFTLQPCSPDADSYTLMMYSPAYSVLA